MIRVDQGNQERFQFELSLGSEFAASGDAVTVFKMRGLAAKRSRSISISPRSLLIRTDQGGKMNLLRVSPLGFQDKDEKGVVAGAGSLDFFSLPDASVRSEVRSSACSTRPPQADQADPEKMQCPLNRRTSSTDAF